MPRKRSASLEETTQLIEVKRSPGENGRVPRPSREYRQALCPVCGSSHGQKRLEYKTKGYWDGGATQNYWEWLAERDAERGLDTDEHFGVIQEVGQGRGRNFSIVGYFGPEDDPDGYFRLVKARMLTATRRWLAKGWITIEEIENERGKGALPLFNGRKNGQGRIDGLGL